MRIKILTWSVLRAPLVMGLLASGCARRESPSATPASDVVWVDPAPDCSATSARFLPAVRASDAVSGPPAKYDQEQLGVWLARRVPGGYAFGTMVDSSRNVGIVWLRDPSRKADALAALDTLLPPNYPNFSRTHPDSVEAHKVRWDYAELYDWMHYLQGSMRDLEGVEITGWSTDPLGNRLLFGIENREMMPTMINWLVGKHIPCRLVQLMVMGSVRAM